MAKSFKLQQFIVARGWWPLWQNFTKKISTKIDSSKLDHLLLTFFCLNLGFFACAGFALWIQIVDNFQSWKKVFRPKLALYSDCAMINHRCLLNLISGSIFHHLEHWSDWTRHLLFSQQNDDLFAQTQEGHWRGSRSRWKRIYLFSPFNHNIFLATAISGAHWWYGVIL